MHSGQPIAAAATRKRARKEISKTLANGQKSVKSSVFVLLSFSRLEAFADQPNPCVLLFFLFHTWSGWGFLHEQKEWPEAPKKRRVNLPFICTPYIPLLFGTFMPLETDTNLTWQAASGIRAGVR